MAKILVLEDDEMIASGQISYSVFSDSAQCSCYFCCGAFYHTSGN